MQQIRIDFDNPGLPQSLGAVEGESQSRIFQAALYKSGAAYTAPAGAVYSIMYRGFGPQNQGWYDTIEDGAGKRAACTVSGNVVTCELARQALRVPGHLTVVLCVSDAKGYMLKSWPIMADVRNDGYEDTGESEMYFNLSGIAGNYLTQLEKAMANAETTKNNLTTTATQTKKDITDTATKTKADIDAKAAAALKSIPESYTELDGSVKRLEEDINYSNDGKKRDTFDYGIGYTNAQKWEPSNYVTVPVSPEFDGKITQINVKASESGTISIVVLEINGSIYSGIKATERSKNSYEVVNGDNTIACDIDIQSGNVVAFKPSGCSIYYENNESGRYTYIYNGSTLDRPGDYKRFYGFSYNLIHDNNEHLYVEHKFSNIDENLSKHVDIYVEDVKNKATVYSSLFYGDSIADIAAPSDVEPFIFFTDPHTLEMDNWQSGCESLMLSLKNYYDATPVSYVLCGGDWIGNSDLPEVSCYKLGLIHGMMRKLFERYYYVIGNHDTNYQGKLTDESEKYTTRLSQIALQNLLYNGEKTYYVFQGNRTKFYCLDTGVEWSSLSTYYSEEMEWFASNLIKDNSEHIAILLHILYSDGVKTTISSEITKIAEAYNGKSTIIVNEKSYDFSQCKGKIEFYLAGHTHADSNGLEGSIPYVITRKAFESQKPTFDLTMVDYDNRAINMIRIGNGNSRKISLDSGEIIS